MSSLRPAVAVAALTTVLLGAAVPPAPADARGTKAVASAKAKKAKAKKRAKRAARIARTCRRHPSRKICKVTARTAILDRTAPTLSITAPAAGSTVSGTLTGSECVASAKDRSGIDEVEFTLDG